MKAGDKVVYWKEDAWGHPPCVTVLLRLRGRYWETDQGLFSKATGIKKGTGGLKARYYINQDFDKAQPLMDRSALAIQCKGLMSKIHTQLWLINIEKDVSPKLKTRLKRILKAIEEKR